MNDSTILNILKCLIDSRLAQESSHDTQCILFAYRCLCKKWNSFILNLPENAEWCEQYNAIEQCLKHDDTLYDEDYYARIILINKYADISISYTKIMVPHLCWFTCDINDSNRTFASIQLYSAPLEINMFFYKYMKNPSTKVILYSAEFIRSIILDQLSELQEKLSSDLIDNIFLLIPICYAKHHKMCIQDTQKLCILCYVNLIDTKLEDYFPLANERFIICDMPAKNFDDIPAITKCCLEQENSDNSLSKRESIIQICQSLPRAFNALLKEYSIYQ